MEKVPLSFVCLIVIVFIDLANSQMCDGSCSSMTSCPIDYFGTCCHKENIAIGKNTSQSSNYGTFTSDLAVDGNTNTSNNDGLSCSHTDDSSDSPGATWTVDLGSLFNISQIRIYLRTDNINDETRTRNRYLKVRVDNSECFRSTSTTLVGLQNVTCSTPLQGSSVTIQVEHRYLALCEVQIFMCADGWYGEDCERQCQCKDGDECDKETGWCSNGCRAGKQADGCQCDCADGRYGLECRNRCGNCTNNSTCNKINGTCHQGCAPHFKPPYCQDCNEYFHLNGSICERCGHCEKNQSCNTASGECGGRCEVGYKPPYCKEVCDDGTYGQNCHSSCGYCLNGSTCNKNCGHCREGCDSNFSPPLCTKCVDGRFGLNCESTCGHCPDTQPCNKTTGECTHVSSSNSKPPFYQETNDVTIAVAAICCMLFGIVSTLISLAVVKKIRKKEGSSQTEAAQDTNVYNSISLDVVNENQYTGLQKNTKEGGKEDKDKDSDYYNTVTTLEKETF